MRQVLRMTLSALTSCINLFEELWNLFYLKVSRADPDYNRVAVEEGQWKNLPRDLLSRIVNGLGLMDFLSLRCVCKDWHIASKFSHEDKSSEFEPWFLIYGGEGPQCSLISNDYKRYMSQILELEGAACLASYEGWLLLFRQGSLFFFCPFSKAKIELPSCPFNQITDHIAAFSSAPTAQDCTVVVVYRISFYKLQLFMICRGEKVWTTYDFFYFNLDRIRTALFYEGEGKEFHFLDGRNGLIIFNASKNPPWKCYTTYPSRTELSSEDLVLKYTITESLFEHHNDTGMVRFLEENDSIKTCGTRVPRFRGKFDRVIGSESIAAPNQSQTRHLKGVWIKPKYCYVPPAGQTW